MTSFKCECDVMSQVGDMTMYMVLMSNDKEVIASTSFVLPKMVSPAMALRMWLNGETVTVGKV